MRGSRNALVLHLQVLVPLSAWLRLSNIVRGVVAGQGGEARMRR